MHNVIESARHVAPFWGWPVVLDIFLGGLAAGVMIVSVLAARSGKVSSRLFRLLPFAAPIAISVALFALFLDLENKAHAFRFYTAFRVTSPMSWGAWILLLIYPATLLYGLSRLTSEEVAKLPRFIAPSARWGRANGTFLARANVVLGVALGTYTGVLLMSTARPAWASITIAPLFLAAAVVSGAAFCKLVPLDAEEHVCVCRWLVGAMLAELALLFAYFVDLSGTRALFFGGSFTAPMWSLVVIAGLVVPLILQALEMRGRASPAVIVPALILIGSFAFRWIIVSAGQVAL